MRTGTSLMINNDAPGLPCPTATVDTKGIIKGRLHSSSQYAHDRRRSQRKRAFPAASTAARTTLRCFFFFHPPPGTDQNNPDPTVQIGRAYCNICNSSLQPPHQGRPGGKRAAHTRMRRISSPPFRQHPSAVSFVKPDGLSTATGFFGSICSRAG